LARLDAAIHDLKLVVALDAHDWQLAQRHDQDAARKLVEELHKGQTDIKFGVEEVLLEVQQLKKDIELEGRARSFAESASVNGSGAGARAKKLNEPWEVYPKEVRFIKDEFDDRIELGSGAFGSVFSGTFRGHPVAVKQVKIGTRELMEMAQSEVRLLFRLHHPNIVVMYGASFDSSRCLIVMERLESSLHNVIYAHAECVVELEPESQRRLAVEIASGMAYLHSCDVVHRDLKLENVLVDHKRSARITDFGLAKTKDNSIGTVYVNAAGTLLYTPPELLVPKGRGKKSVDVYSYAVLVNEMYSRQPPYSRNPPRAPVELTSAVVEGLRPDLAPGLPEELRSLVTTGWAANPSERPTFDHIVATLHGWSVPARAALVPTPPKFSKDAVFISEFAFRQGLPASDDPRAIAFRPSEKIFDDQTLNLRVTNRGKVLQSSWDLDRQESFEFFKCSPLLKGGGLHVCSFQWKGMHNDYGYNSIEVDVVDDDLVSVFPQTGSGSGMDSQDFVHAPSVLVTSIVDLEQLIMILYCDGKRVSWEYGRERDQPAWNETKKCWILPSKTPLFWAVRATHGSASIVSTPADLVKTICLNCEQGRQVFSYS
jgi:serine/threonine protein kinase